MRLDKYIASVSDYSRSEVKKLIKNGRVSIAGELYSDPGFAVPEDAEVLLDDEPLRRPGYRYFMLNKPAGYVCANKDRRNMTVMELLDEDNRQHLHVAGRLDIDTTGPVLLSDDGQWTHRITSPAAGCRKQYYVETAEPITPSYRKRFLQGIRLAGEKRLTRPAELNIIDEQSARLLISEGKYHQVKRMFAALGNRVDCLHREKIGDIVLDESLCEGEYRALTEQEVHSV